MEEGTNLGSSSAASALPEGTAASPPPSHRPSPSACAGSSSTVMFQQEPMQRTPTNLFLGRRLSNDPRGMTTGKREPSRKSMSEADIKGITDEKQAEALGADIAASVKNNQRAMAAANKPPYILMPEHGLVSMKDLLSTIALILLYFVLPFEIAFVDAPNVPDASDPLYIFNRVIDVVFLFDMGLQFFIAYPKSPMDEEFEEDDGDKGVGDAVSTSQELEYRMWRIALNYSKGWLLLDLLAVVPSAFDVIFALGGAEDDALGLNSTALGGNETAILGVEATNLAAVRAARTVKLVKLIRMARMLKMLRLLRLVKAFKAAKQMMTPDSFLGQAWDVFAASLVEHMRKLRLIKLLLGVFVTAHMLACILGLSAVFAEEKLLSWWGTHGYCYPDELYTLNGPNGILKSRCVPAMMQYAVCYHFALSTVFRVPIRGFIMAGPGEPYPIDPDNPDSGLMFQPHEHVVFTTIWVCGAMMGMYVAGVFVAVVTARDGATIAEQVTRFCKKYRVPAASRRQLQDYFHSLSQLTGTVPAGDLFFKISPSLQVKLLMDIHGFWLHRLPFSHFLVHGFQGRAALWKANTNALLSQIALSMTPALFIAKERPKSGSMYHVINGVAFDMCRKTLVRPGDDWGAFEMLAASPNSKAARLKGFIKALTPLQVVYISRDRFYAIPTEHPDVIPAFRKVKIWLMFKKLEVGLRREAFQARLAIPPTRSSPDATKLAMSGTPPLQVRETTPAGDDADVRVQLAEMRAQLAMLCAHAQRSERDGIQPPALEHANGHIDESPLAA